MSDWGVGNFYHLNNVPSEINDLMENKKAMLPNSWEYYSIRLAIQPLISKQ